MPKGYGLCVEVMVCVSRVLPKWGGCGLCLEIMGCVWRLCYMRRAYGLYYGLCLEIMAYVWRLWFVPRGYGLCLEVMACA